MVFCNVSGISDDCDKLNMNIINLRETTRKVKETVQLINY